MKKILCLILCLTMLIGCTSALADEAAAAAAAEAAATMTVEELVAAAQGEGQLFSVGMPDEWANWKSLWAYITDTYGINHSDTDMSSAEELARFALEGKADADITYAWPGAVISALTPEAAVAVLYADQVKADKDLSVEEARAKYAGEYVEKVAGAVNAAKDGMVDDIIDPAKTRAMLISALEMLGSKRDSNPPKKHDNLPM